jgi:DNA-binding SARP family transcriptional activator
MTRLAIRLLGPFQVDLDGEPVTGFETEKVRALLAYLATEAYRPHRREFLAEMLWPDRPEGAARANLRHALGNLRTVIGDRARSGEPDSAPPFLLVTRETLQLNAGADVWVDTAAVVKSLQGRTPNTPPPVSQLEEAAGLCRGMFLEDISIGDSAAFHEWVLLKGEQFRRQALSALYRLAECYEARGDYKRALDCAWRQLDLTPWDEGVHQHVMHLLALSGQRGAALAQYEACRRVLAEELGVQPQAETTELFENIRDGRFEIPTRPPKPESIFQIPGFLEQENDDVEPPVFVARERELAWLESHLDHALAGRGQVVFVTGDPGRGKTALLGEFARRAMGTHPDLLVAWGDCNAYSGVGDPYLPFRDVIAMLTGDVESRWAAGLITGCHARRFWDVLPVVVQTLVTRGTALIGTVLAGEALLSRAAAVLPDRGDWLGLLQALTERARTGRVDLEQSHLFEQYTDVLRVLADRHPLALVLDDMQWADGASVGLLFHLGRRLADTGSRVLIACAYRPEEVAKGRPLPNLQAEKATRSAQFPGQGQMTGHVERHSLEKVLQEFKRRFGDVNLDLGQVPEAEERGFVDAFLDAEPNRLGERFRAALFHHTQGHPLFTVELLRAMQERGDLLRDGDGCWVEGPTLDWEVLPARVEAVIEQRLGGLDPELSQILTVASVEGEVFTAQVVAQVQKMEERPLLRRLSTDLERRHRLVKEQGEVPSDRGRIARYRFGHVLIQDFIYRRLGRAERQLLHGEVATALENLYAGQLDEIAVRLAHHFHRATDYDRAFHYFAQAAENAARVYANAEAVTHYTQAIELTERISADAVSRTNLHRGRGLAHETLGYFDLARADHDTALQIACAAGQRHAEWRAYLDLGRLWASRDYDRAHDCFAGALELARRMGDPAVLASSLNWMGNWYVNAEQPRKGVEYHREALEIFEDIGDQRQLAVTLDLLGIANIIAADPAKSFGYFDRAIALFRELDDRPNLASSLTGRGNLGGASYASLALVPVIKPREAQRDFEEANQIAQEIDSPAAEAWVHWSASLMHTVQGHFGDALEAAQNGLRIASAIGHREWVTGNRSALGVLYCELLAPEAARHQLEQALSLAKELRSQHWIYQTTGTLAQAYCLLEDLKGAQSCLETVIHPETPMDTLHKRCCWARRAELALFQGDAALALDIAERLIASAPGMQPGCVISFLWKLRGDALAAMGCAGEAESLLCAAIENARATGERFLLWRLNASLARLYRATDRKTKAEQALSAASELVAELAASIPDKALKDNFLERAHSILRSPA